MAKSTDIKEKIRHLLALAQSPNEHEALAALLKARELMARHKLTEATLEKANGQAVKDIKTNITFSKRRDPWIASLSSVICKSYCCKGYRTHIKGRQTQTVGFIGLENDVEICTTVFRYAVDCVYAEIKRIKIENEGRPRSYVGTLCDSYGYGFAAFLKRSTGSSRRTRRNGVLFLPCRRRSEKPHRTLETSLSRPKQRIKSAPRVLCRATQMASGSTPKGD